MRCSSDDPHPLPGEGDDGDGLLEAADSTCNAAAANRTQTTLEAVGYRGGVEVQGPPIFSGLARREDPLQTDCSRRRVGTTAAAPDDGPLHRPIRPLGRIRLEDRVYPVLALRSRRTPPLDVLCELHSELRELHSRRDPPHYQGLFPTDLHPPRGHGERARRSLPVLHSASRIDGLPRCAPICACLPLARIPAWSGPDGGGRRGRAFSLDGELS